MLKKTVVITGAGGVLCGCFAKRLAKEGYRVALLDIQLDAAEAVAAEIRAEGGDARAFQANVLDKESLAAAKAAVNAAFGPVTHLINGAGGNNPKGTTTNETFRRGVLLLLLLLAACAAPLLEILFTAFLIIDASTLSSTGIPKAAVFPVPVCACPITSLPESTAGIP